MGHAHHFLSRLDRVSLPHVELALGLYNDAALLQFILCSVQLPERAQRVAISLDDPTTGPFLVVTREGRFVTCLGAGMSSGDLPVITRGQLDAISARCGELRGRLVDAQRLVGPNGHVSKLLARIGNAGDELAREEIAAVIGLQPLYAPQLLIEYFGVSAEMFDARTRLLKHTRRDNRQNPAYFELLHAYYKAFWAIGHLAVLIAQDGPGLMLRLPKEAIEMFGHASLSWPAVRQGITALAFKGIWTISRIGRPQLSDTIGRWMGARTMLKMLDSGMSLAALGLRHPKLLDEAREALLMDPDPGEPLLAKKEHMDAFIPQLRHIMSGTDDVFEDAKQCLVRLGSTHWVARTRKMPRSTPLRFEREEDVPEDLAISYALNLPLDALGDMTSLSLMILALPWVARAAPEQLYMTRAALAVSSAPWEPEHTWRLLRQQRDFYETGAPTPEVPARKGPCPCGSGKKYKRCCGEATETA